MILVLAAATFFGGCATRQQVAVVEIPKIETISCVTEQEDVTLFVNSEEEARSQVIEAGYRVINVRQATLEPAGVRHDEWIVTASRRVCRPAS